MAETPKQINVTATGLGVDVEVSPGSGVFRFDPRLRAEKVTRFSDDRISEATIAVRLDSAFDALEVRDRYLPDNRLVIWADDPANGSRTVLFDGYPIRHVFESNGRPSRPGNGLRLEAVGVYSRWAADARSQVFGRQMRNAAILDALEVDPSGLVGSSVLVQALACVFNDDRRPNRSPDPILITDADGISHRIYIFTYEGDPLAESWTLLDAFRYLLWFYRLPEGPVFSTHLFTMTSAFAGMDPNDLGRVVPDSRLVSRLLVSADDLNCEATNLVEAIALIAERAGVHATCEPQLVAGVVQSELRLWAPEDGESKRLNLAWGGRYADGSKRYDASNVTERDIFEANEIGLMELEWDHSTIINAPTVIGAVKRWEMTVPLVPGWAPEVNLDNVDPPDRVVAKLLALTPDQVNFAGPDAELSAWYRMYHRNGSEFEDHRNVSRLWVLNEDGAFSGAVFNRNAPFDSYGPFDFATVVDDHVTTLGQWGRRPRLLKDSITLAADGSDFGVFVEVSFDGGLSWSKPVGQVTVLKDRAGIWFGVVNPTSMIEPDGNPAVRNMWYALIDQLFHVRVTASFEADERLISQFDTNAAHTPTVHTNAQFVYKPGLYKFSSRIGTVDALSTIDSGVQAFEVDDSAAAKAVAVSIASDQQEGRIEIEVGIPWIDQCFSIGDRIKGASARDVQLNGRLAHGMARDSDWAVVGKTYSYGASKVETRLLLSRRTANR